MSRRYRRGRSISGSPSLFGLSLLAGALAVAHWRPEWLTAAGTWYFTQCQAVATALVSSMIHP